MTTLTFTIENRSYDDDGCTQTVSDRAGNSLTFRHGVAPHFDVGTKVVEISARPRDRGYEVVLGTFEVAKVRPYKRHTNVITSDGREWTDTGFAWADRDAVQFSDTVIKQLVDVAPAGGASRSDLDQLKRKLATGNGIDEADAQGLSSLIGAKVRTTPTEHGYHPILALVGAQLGLVHDEETQSLR